MYLKLPKYTYERTLPIAYITQIACILGTIDDDQNSLTLRNFFFQNKQYNS